jgi:hypothetical protein
VTKGQINEGSTLVTLRGCGVNVWGGGFAVFADQRQPAPLRASELPGTYELVDRVLVGGKVLRRPDIAALYTFGNGRALVCR